MFERANTRKHVREYSCSSVRVFLSILAHLAHLAQVFFSDFKWDRLIFWCKHANTRKHVSEHSWSSGWVILSILAHLAHLAQSYFSLIFSAINTYNCAWFDLTNKNICSDWRQKLGEKWPMLMTFFLTAIAAITGNFRALLPLFGCITVAALSFISPAKLY